MIHDRRQRSAISPDPTRRDGGFFVSFINFSPAVSNKAAKAIRDTIRSWKLPKRSDKAIEDLSRMFNPIISAQFSETRLGSHACVSRMLDGIFKKLLRLSEA